MDTVKAIRKHSAQHDLFNRLHSINADAAFVRKVAQEWYEGRFLVVPNLRCGAWYCDPSSSSSQYAYFKSTDGHTNNWGFNLRRSNLGLAKYAEDHGGIILVDSTRRGKRMPDALSKTVPIWCAVINLAVQIRRGEGTSSLDVGTALYTPPNIVSPSEKAQIEALLLGWTEALESSNIPLLALRKPLRPFFIHPSTSSPPAIRSHAPFIPIICLSASRWIGPESVDDIPSFTRLPPVEDEEARTVGFEYVQGAGDDHESWGRGLTPELFHEHRARILRAEREEVPELVDEIVLLGQTAKLDLVDPREHPNGTQGDSIVTGFPSSSSRLALAIGPPAQDSSPWTYFASPTSSYQTIWVVAIDKSQALSIKHIIPLSSTECVFACPSARDAGKDFSNALESLIAHVRRLESSVGILLRPGAQQHLDGARALGVDQMEKGPSKPLPLFTPISLTSEHRKVILPLALALAVAIPEVSGTAIETTGSVSKADIAEVLHSLITLWPDGNPPRAALKRVNEYLMSGAHRPRT